MKIAIDIDSTLHDYWDQFARRRPAPLRRHAPVRGPGHVGGHAAAPGAGPRRRDRDPRRAARARRRALSRRRRGRPRLARGRPLHPHHLAPRDGLPPVDRRLAGPDRPALRRALLLVRQGHPLRGDRHRPARRRLAAQPRARDRRRHAHRDAAAPVEPRDLRDGGRRSAPRTGPSSRAAWSRCWHELAPRAPARAAVARPARPPARDRARADRHRLGPLRARRAAARPDALLVPLPLLVPLRGRGDREHPGHRRRAARRQPRRRAPAGRVDDRQGDPGGAPAPAQAPPHRRALLQGLSVLLHVRGQDRRRPRAPGQRPAAAARRAAARARLPGGRQGDGQALQGPLQAAPLRPRRLRRGGGEGGRADRPRRPRRRRGGDADVRPDRAAQAAHRA